MFVKKIKDVPAIHAAADSVFTFIQANKENLKSNFSVKILEFYFRVNQSIDFLLATRRHQTPGSIRLVVLLTIYIFVIFYPAALLKKLEPAFRSRCGIFMR